MGTERGRRKGRQTGTGSRTYRRREKTKDREKEKGTESIKRGSDLDKETEKGAKPAMGWRTETGEEDKRAEKQERGRGDK